MYVALRSKRTYQYPCCEQQDPNVEPEHVRPTAEPHLPEREVDRAAAMPTKRQTARLERMLTGDGSKTETIQKYDRDELRRKRAQDMAYLILREGVAAERCSPLYTFLVRLVDSRGLDCDVSCNTELLTADELNTREAFLVK